MFFLDEFNFRFLPIPLTLTLLESEVNMHYLMRYDTVKFGKLSTLSAYYNIIPFMSTLSSCCCLLYCDISV
jgi:hypothetical protein